MAPQIRSRLEAWLPALLLFAGSLLFLGAGRLHPTIGTSLGPEGSAEFFRAFAAEMLHMHNWESVHLGILVGPVLWALASTGTARLLSPRATALGDVGRTALLLGAALWSVAFILDGFVGPRLAEAISAAGVGADAVAINAFRANALTMARLGMISIALIGVGILTFASGLLIDARVRSWTAAVGALGVIAGAWPIIATVSGEFSPGPFTSPYWTITALSIGLWFLLLGSVLPRLGKHAPQPQRSTSDLLAVEPLPSAR